MNVIDNISDGKYVNTIPWSYEMVPVDEETMTVRQAKEHKEEQKRLRDEHRKKHREEDGRLNALFRANLEEQYGLVGHPKADKLWSLAWEQGHAEGYLSVAYAYGDLTELVRA